MMVQRKSRHPVARCCALPLLLLGFVATGCGPNDAGEIEGSRAATAALSAGCVVDCPPPCEPGEPCQLRPCRLICPPGVTPCGDTTCQNGDVCCNESCGICTPPGGACTQQYCDPGTGPCTARALCKPRFRWSAERCACVADDDGELCRKDSDCALFSDYCTGCDCRALSRFESEPACGLPGVRCFADPCMNQRAACVQGRCAVQSAEGCTRSVECRSGYRFSEVSCACVRDRPSRPFRPVRPPRPIRPPHVRR